MDRAKFTEIANSLPKETLIDLAFKGYNLAVGVRERIDLDNLTNFPKGGNSHIGARNLVEEVDSLLVNKNIKDEDQ